MRLQKITHLGYVWNYLGQGQISIFQKIIDLS